MSNPTTPAEAIAVLRRELPAFASGKFHAFMDYEQCWQAEISTNSGEKLLISLYESEDYGSLIPTWDLTLITSAKLTTENHATLAEAIAALKSAAEEQRRVLGLVE